MSNYKNNSDDPKNYIRNIEDSASNKINTIQSGIRKGNQIHSLRLDTWNKSVNQYKKHHLYVNKFKD